MSFVTVLFITENSTSELSERILTAMEYVVHPSDWGYNEIHAEIIVKNRCYSAVGRPPDSCVIKYDFTRYRETLPCAECVQVPVTDVDKAQRILEYFSSTHATYEIPTLDFFTPSIFLDDLDFNPDHWGHLYCSQFVLICLRRMCQAGLIPLQPDRLAHLYDCSSRTCTPAHLKHILDRMLN